MIETKIMTTRQKKFLEKVLKCLDVTVDEFLEIQNIKNEREETRLKIEALNKNIGDLEYKNKQIQSLLDRQEALIKNLTNSYNIIVQKLNELNMNAIFGDIYSNNFGGDK